MTSIRKSLLTGVFYTAISKYSNIFFSIIIGAVLARLLTPDEFGIVAIVTVFVTFFNLLVDFRIGPAIIQNQGLNEEDISSIFTFSIIIGISFAIIFFLSAPFIAWFYNSKELINVSRLLSISILFYSFQIIPYALSQKDLKFKQIGIINIVVQLITGVIAIFFAYQGFSYYSLVIRSILISLFTFILFYWFSPIKLALRINWDSVKKIGRFSIFQFSFNFINYFSRNADNLLIGKFFGVAQLGYYDKSYRLMSMPITNLTHVITPVLMPVLSKYSTNKRKVYNDYTKVVRLLSTIGFPLAVFLYFSASEIITLLYGSQWSQSIPIFKLLALTVGIQIVTSSTGSIFQAVNRTDLLFYSGFLSALIMIGGICYGVFIGKTLVSVGYGLIIAFTINFFQSFYFLIKKALDESVIIFNKIFLLPVIISFAIVLLNFVIISFHIENIIMSLIFKTFFSAILFLILFPQRQKIFSLIKSSISEN